MNQPVPCKNDIIINPKTSRPVRVGSPTWRKLVKEQVVPGHYRNTSVLHELKEGEDVEEVKQKYKKMVPPDKIVAKGRGLHANKIVAKSAPLKPDFVTDLISTTLSDNYEQFEGLSTEDIKLKLKELLVKPQKTVPYAKITTKAPKRVPKKEPRFVEAQEQKENDEDGDQDEAIEFTEKPPELSDSESELDEDAF